MWTTLTAASGLVVLDGRLLMIRQLRPYGVFWEMPSGYYEPNESLEQTPAPVLDRWWTDGETGFYVHAEVDVLPDGTQDYRFRP